jgi:hypothetical protein
MKINNLIQYRSRYGITSYGFKIKDMSRYKMLPTIQNRPPKDEYELKIPNTKNKGYVQPPLCCWYVLLDDKKANISAQLKEVSKQCQTTPKDRSRQGKSLPAV